MPSAGGEGSVVGECGVCEEEVRGWWLLCLGVVAVGGEMVNEEVCCSVLVAVEFRKPVSRNSATGGGSGSCAPRTGKAPRVSAFIGTGPSRCFAASLTE